MEAIGAVFLVIVMIILVAVALMDGSAFLLRLGAKRNNRRNGR